jgi:hypothetical protein
MSVIEEMEKEHHDMLRIWRINYVVSVKTGAREDALRQK